MADDLRHRYAEALAAKFTNPRYRYDRKTDAETVENPEPADRVDHAMAVHFVAGDGLPSSRMVTCNEAAEVCAAVRDEEMEGARRALAEVRRLHSGPRTERHGSGCVQCGIVWPCPTILAIGDTQCVE